MMVQVKSNSFILYEHLIKFLKRDFLAISTAILCGEWTRMREWHTGVLISYSSMALEIVNLIL